MTKTNLAGYFGAMSAAAVAFAAAAVVGAAAAKTFHSAYASYRLRW